MSRTGGTMSAPLRVREQVPVVTGSLQLLPLTTKPILVTYLWLDSFLNGPMTTVVDGSMVDTPAKRWWNRRPLIKQPMKINVGVADQLTTQLTSPGTGVALSRPD